MRYRVGIDEAGRGALAGPVCVGAVLVPEDFDWREAYQLVTRRGAVKLKDSKKLTGQQRDILYKYIVEHGMLRHAAAFVDAHTIDEIGIVNAANQAASVAARSLEIAPARVDVLLDAGLRVPSHWSQESFVRGDETIPAISLASIIAKVSRDRYMEDIAKDFAQYGFEAHKGYGTVYHRSSIARYGLSSVHRVTFCGGVA